MQLGQLAELFPNVPRIALTATADKRTREEIVQRLHLENAERFLSSFDRPNIFYRIVPKEQPRKQLLGFLAERRGDAGIVYCMSRKRSMIWPPSSPNRAFRRCLITRACPTSYAPITRSAFSTRKG